MSKNKAKKPEPIESGTYTLPEAARRFGIGVATMYDLNRRGEVPVEVIKIGGALRVRKADVEALIAPAASAS